MIIFNIISNSKRLSIASLAEDLESDNQLLLELTDHTKFKIIIERTDQQI